MFRLIAITLISFIPDAEAFGRISSHHIHRNPYRLAIPNSPLPLFAGDEQGTSVQEDAQTLKALGPAPPVINNDIDRDNGGVSLEGAGSASKQVFMITREMKRTMVEELGYRRAEVDVIRVELVSNILENRIRCPLEGIPTDWIDQEREAMNEAMKDSMIERLEGESKYPLKFPLLAASTILFGKGFSDALITIIKVNIDFPGASLTQQFQGIPVLAIDFICVAAGMALGLWTWKTMK